MENRGRAQFSIQNKYDMGNNEEDLLDYSESTRWPLQAGYPGLTIKNLNEYVSLFSHCLVNIQNYQGIEIIGIQSPVYLTRFDAAYLEVCETDEDDSYEVYEYYDTFIFFFGKIPPKSERNCSADYSEAVKYSDKSINARWVCSAQFDLFFPEPNEAQLITEYQLEEGSNLLFDIDPEYISFPIEPRDGWSKMRHTFFSQY